MSNRSILERLEQALVQYESGALSRTAFVQFLTSSIEALEGVPYSVRLELRDHEWAIETEGYGDGDDFPNTNPAAKQNLKSWIHQLMLNHAQSI